MLVLTRKVGVLLFDQFEEVLALDPTDIGASRRPVSACLALPEMVCFLPCFSQVGVCRRG